MIIEIFRFLENLAVDPDTDLLALGMAYLNHLLG
jgi:hypothetical protein